MKHAWRVAAMVLGLAAGASMGADERAVAAQKYRAGGEPVRAGAGGLIVCEAEEFRVRDAKGWKAAAWGENYYAATFANSFLSRKAFLGAPAECEETVASVNVEVPAAGRYLVLARYEAAYRFQTQFRIRIEQGGKTVLDRLYGARENVKIWAFSEKLKPEVAWSWGAVENVVWEGHDAFADLQPGPAAITLVAGPQPAPQARRNVDLVMLTTDAEGVRKRIETESYLPLDGLLTQEGDVLLRVHNLSDGAVTVTAPPCTQHSPYWVHQRTWKPVSIQAGPKASSEWTDVGGVLDTLNDGQWTLQAAPAVKAAPIRYKAEFAVRTAAGGTERIAEVEIGRPSFDLAFAGDMRYSRALRPADRVLTDLLDYLRAQPVRGRVPERTLIYGFTFGAREGDAAYNAKVDEFVRAFGLAAGSKGEPGGKPGTGYLDVRSVATDALEAHCKALGDKAAGIACVSLGDEIGLGAPKADDHDGFRAWLKAQGVRPGDVVPGAGDDGWAGIAYAPKADRAAQPGLYYWSKRYAHHVGIMELKARTDILRRCLPTAGIGANYSPHGGPQRSYLGEVHQWVTLFRDGAMTMPWGEDYIWQVPVGSPQMNFINLDLFRAGIRGKPAAKIHYYVMPHWPGNTTAMWRRQFYGDLAHGMKIVNLFCFVPVEASYTENHVSLPAMYREVRDSFRELGLFEDIVQDGQVRPGLAALWFSEAGDIWNDEAGSMAAGKRSLYCAIRHAQLPLDMVVEEDATGGALKDYAVLYLTDAHVSAAASRAIAEWVRGGGRLFATAGAGMFDELNRPNAALREVLGVDQASLEAPADAQVGFIKQDMPFARAVTAASWKAGDRDVQVPAFGAVSRVKAADADVVARFGDGAPAVVSRAVGKGTATYCAFLPGLSYFYPAIPLRPVDRGSTDEAMAHLVPTGFDVGAAELIARPAEGLVRPVVCSEPLVETTVLESRHGMAIPLVNWSGAPVKGLTVRVALAAGKKAELASGGKVAVAKDATATTFTVDLDVADALILRP